MNNAIQKPLDTPAWEPIQHSTACLFLPDYRVISRGTQCLKVEIRRVNTVDITEVHKVVVSIICGMPLRAPHDFPTPPSRSSPRDTHKIPPFLYKSQTRHCMKPAFNTNLRKQYHRVILASVSFNDFAAECCIAIFDVKLYSSLPPQRNPRSTRSSPTHRVHACLLYACSHCSMCLYHGERTISRTVNTKGHHSPLIRFS